MYCGVSSRLLKEGACSSPLFILFEHKRQPEDRHLSPTVHPHTQLSSEVTEEEQVLEFTAQMSPLGSYLKFSLQVCLAQHLLGMKKRGHKGSRYLYSHDSSAGKE